MTSKKFRDFASGEQNKNSRMIIYPFADVTWQLDVGLLRHYGFHRSKLIGCLPPDQTNKRLQHQWSTVLDWPMSPSSPLP